MVRRLPIPHMYIWWNGVTPPRLIEKAPCCAINSSPVRSAQLAKTHQHHRVVWNHYPPLKQQSLTFISHGYVELLWTGRGAVPCERGRQPSPIAPIIIAADGGDRIIPLSGGRCDGRS